MIGYTKLDHFHISNISLVLSCFLLIFIQKVDSQRCGEYISLSTSSSTGTLTSPGYPGNYANLDHCIWLLKAPSGYSVTFTLSSFDGESSGGSCVDYLEFRDGSSDSYQQLKTCSISSSTTVTSTNKYMWIRFKADDNNTFTGFTGTYGITHTGNADVTSPIPRCQAISFRCRNKECVYYGYVCDSQNDCGCKGSGCDENNCGGIQWSEAAMVWCGVGVGVGVFNVIFLGIGVLEIWLQARQRKLNKLFEEEEQLRRKKRRHNQQQQNK